MSSSTIELNILNGEVTKSDEKSKLKSSSQESFWHIQIDLLKFKAFFLYFGASIGSIFPYLSLYYKQLGFSPNQIGIISGARPLIGFCCGPMWGAIADRFRIRKLILSFSAVGWLIFITAIGFVPPAAYSNTQCGFVQEFLAMNSSTRNSSSTLSPQHSGIQRAQFLREHAIIDDVSPKETLLESRGWMFSASGIDQLFVTIITLIVLGEVLQSPLGAIADTGCIEKLGADAMDKYGHQRAFGSIGLGTASMLAGSLVSISRTNMTVCGLTFPHSEYNICFYQFAICMTCCLVTTFFFTFKQEDNGSRASLPKPNPLKVFRMFFTLHYGSWLFCLLFTGLCNGVILGFLNWHLENLGASQLMIGLANLTSLISETIMFLMVFRILSATSCLTFMILGLLGYVVRFAGFSIIQNAWLVLPFEVLQGFTFAGIWSVYVKYLCNGVPSEYLGTLQGFLHGFYWGLGSGTGNLLGGLAVEKYGARWTFRIFAVASLINLVLFVCIQKFTTRPKVFDYDSLEDKK